MVMKYDKKQTDSVTKGSLSKSGSHGERMILVNLEGNMIVESKIELEKSSMMNEHANIV
jgi:hypothetical protein